MTLRISGIHLDLGDALRGRIKERVSEAITPVFGERYSGHFTVKKDGHQFLADCLIHIDNASTIHSDAKAADAYAACDAAVHKIEKNLRRYKSKLKARVPHHAPYEATSYVIEAPDDEAHDITDFKPVIVAETNMAMGSFSVGQAVEELDMTGAPFLVFKHAANGRVNFVFRRADGNVGWIDPQAMQEMKKAA
jgi:ribosomal subunit interface protein